MQSRWEQKKLDEVGFDALVQELSAYEAWKVVPPEEPYGSLKALLEAEIGCSEEEARERLAAQATGSGPRGGRPRKTCDSQVLTQRERARRNGIGMRAQHELDFLAGHREDLLHEVQIGLMSIHAAFERAKGRVPETPFEKLLRAWRRVSREDRRRFLREMLTEQERFELAKELEAIETRIS